MSNSLQTHGLQNARLPCPSPTPGAGSNSCPSSQWCHPDIWSSVIPFSSCPQSFSASGSFAMSHFFASGGPSIGASASVLPRNIQDWNDPQILLPLNRMKVKASILRHSAFFIVQLSPHVSHQWHVTMCIRGCNCLTGSSAGPCFTGLSSWARISLCDACSLSQTSCLS